MYVVRLVTSAVLCARQVYPDSSVHDTLPLLLKSAGQNPLTVNTRRVIGAAMDMAGVFAWPAMPPLPSIVYYSHVVLAGV